MTTYDLRRLSKISQDKGNRKVQQGGLESQGRTIALCVTV